MVVVASMAMMGLKPLGSMAATTLPPGWHKGANFTSWWHDGYERPEAGQQLTALRSTGTTHVGFIATWYMDTGTSSAVAPDPLKTPSDDGLRSVVARAKSLGMSVALKPHVDVRDGTFRGAITPADREGWFASYVAMLRHYAHLAQESGVDVLIVGTELTSMSKDTDKWRAMIADTRGRFRGKLTFAANWTDGARKVDFWPALDFIGIDVYMPLVSSEPVPTTETLARSFCFTKTEAAGARRYVLETYELHRRFQRPILFTEIGYRSQLSAAAAPWSDTGGAPSVELQERAYEAVYRVWSKVPWVVGLYWWDWPAGTGAPQPTSYTPQGKPAATTLLQWNAGQDGSRTTGPCPAAHRPVWPEKARLTVRPRINRGRVKRTLRSLVGRFRTPNVVCRQAVVIRLERRGRARKWHRRIRVKVDPRSSGRFRVKNRLKRLSTGRYRARAWASGPPCGLTRSRYVKFRLR